ncbi:MAG: hypothetical protein HYZ92_02955 [Candidatus Omnitrophica bacterium]|nr:hypothetical protein [Candidatus Omnitrophota bacterium]
MRMLSVTVAAVLGLVTSGTSAWSEAPEDPQRQQEAQHVDTTTAGVSAVDEPTEAADGEQGPAPTTVSMDFQDASLKDVLKAFSQQTGINLIASQDVEDRTITIYLEDVAVIDALNQIVDASNLTYERPEGSQIYIVKPKPETEKPTGPIVTTKVFRLRFARVSSSRLAKVSDAFASVTPFEAAQMVSALSGIKSGGGGTLGGSSAREIGIDKAVERMLTKDGKLIVDERTNSLIVTDTPINLARIEEVIKAIDIKTSQVLIEAELLETDFKKLKDLGVDWGETDGNTVNLLTLTPGSRSTRFPFGSTGQEIAPSGPTHFTTSTLSATSAKAVLQALERDTTTKILARPKILTLDNESAVIRLTNNEAIGIESQTVSTSGLVLTTPERSITGVILVVTPQINDQQFVTMLVEPSLTNTVKSDIGINTKDPKTRGGRALVRIRQGDTLVLGGLIDRREEQSLKQVPILSGIPIIGEAFKDKETSNTASELIVFITPRILAEPPEINMAAATPGPYAAREQESPKSRDELMEQALRQLE